MTARNYRALLRQSLMFGDKLVANGYRLGVLNCAVCDDDISCEEYDALEQFAVEVNDNAKN